MNFSSLTENEILDFIINYQGNIGGLSRIKDEKFKNLIFEKTTFLDSLIPSFGQRIWHIKFNNYNIVKCAHCNIVPVKFSKGKFYSKFCSDYCTTKFRWNNITKNKKDEFYNKVKETVRSKYGCDFITQTDSFKNKAKSSILKKYGVVNISKLDSIKKKKEDTCFKNFNVKNPSLSEQVKNKRTNTFKEKFGVDNPFKAELIKNKIRETNFKKFGVFHPFQDANFYSKLQFNWKQFVMPSGKIIKYQGYENFALDILLKQGYAEDDIITDKNKIHDYTGHIWYVLDGKQKKFYPDIFLKPEKIIEVKSEYYFNLELDKNMLKKSAVLEKGLKFEFWIFDETGKLLIK